MVKKGIIAMNFFHRSITNIDSYKEVNPENKYKLIHCLMQQKSSKNRSVPFTESMKKNNCNSSFDG